MSPLTGSYFQTWAIYDAPAGPRKETFGSCVHAMLSTTSGPDANYLQALASLNASYCSLHEVIGARDDRVRLRELVTHREHEALSPTGYVGVPGELWYARVLPPATAQCDSGVVFNTPYRVVSPRIDAWLGFMSRTLPKVKGASDGERYRTLMKWGLTANYWNEYVFEAYVNHKPYVVYLAGVPDIPLSRPHSQQSEAIADGREVRD